MSPLLITLVTLIIHLSQAQPSIRSVCLQEPDTGSCRAYLPSFYFNVQTGSCDCFVYGGCAPGGNNFESMETCMMTCGKTQATQVMSRDCRMILSNVNVARPVGPTQNGGQSSSSQSSGPPIGGSSVSNQRPDFNESTVQQLQTIFNEISASSRPSSTQEAIQPPQGQNQQPSNQQRVPNPSTQQRVPPPSTQQRVPPPSGTTATRPVLPPPLPLPRPPPRQTPQSEKDFVLSKTKGDRRRPASSPRADQALQRQIEQQKELERQLQQTIQDHQQLQQQQQQQQQAQLLQQQLQQRQQHQQQLRKQQGAPV